MHPLDKAGHADLCHLPTLSASAKTYQAVPRRVPSRWRTGLDMSNFRVLWLRLIHDKQQDGSKTVQARVFSATDKHDRWVSLSTRVMADDIIPIEALVYLRVPFLFLGPAGGSLWWSVQGGNNVVLHLKESTGKFSYLRMPGQADINSNRRNLRVIGNMSRVRIVGENLEMPRYATHDGGACTVERDGNIGSWPTRAWRLYFFDRAPQAQLQGLLYCVVVNAVPSTSGCWMSTPRTWCRNVHMGWTRGRWSGVPLLDLMAANSQRVLVFVWWHRAEGGRQ